MASIKQQIRYDAERNPAFPKEMMARPGCEKLEACYQCGTCSGVCPLSNYMDHTPRKIIYLTRAGFREDVLRSRTIWLCALCYACTVECPKGIKITDIMYALKRRAIEEGLYPRRFPIAVLAHEFYRMVRSRGRANEARLATWMFLKSRWWQLLGMGGLGLKLLRAGRFTFFKNESIRDTGQLRRILNHNGNRQ